MLLNMKLCIVGIALAMHTAKSTTKWALGHNLLLFMDSRGLYFMFSLPSHWLWFFSQPDDRVLLISTVDIITVDDLSSAQIKRLKTYLQTILSSVASPTKQQREKITPLKSDILKQEQTIPVQKTRDVQLTEESPETNTQEVAIDKLLRKFTAESMKQGKWGDRNSIHSNAFSWSVGIKGGKGNMKPKFLSEKLRTTGAVPFITQPISIPICVIFSQSIVGVRQVNLIASQEPPPPPPPPFFFFFFFLFFFLANSEKYFYHKTF